LVKAGRVHSLVRRAAQYGTLADNVRLDWPAVLRRQRDVVAAFRPPVAAMEKMGARVALGQARFVDAHTVEVGGARLAGEKILIAAGSEPVVPDVPGRELVVTSDDVLFLPDFPPSLTLVGAGAIGIELRARSAISGPASRLSAAMPRFSPDWTPRWRRTCAR